MKILSRLFIIAVVVLSCNHATEIPVEKEVVVPPAPPEKIAFFPVTDYIKGQIAEIRNKGINPHKFTTIHNKLDSAWLKIEQLDTEMAAFLTPIIDSTNFSALFAEKKFLDQTINAFTFTYDPVKALPDSVLLTHWDVYVDPEKSTVKRIYLLKKTTDHKTLQLTWQSDRWCKMVTIADDDKGNAHVEKEVTIKWDF